MRNRHSFGLNLRLRFRWALRKAAVRRSRQVHGRPEALMEVFQMEPNRVRGYRDARLEIDFHTQAVLLDGASIHLTPMEFGLLAQLARQPGEIMSREALMLKVWGYGPEIRSRTMDVHLRRLRVKLGPTAGNTSKPFSGWVTACSRAECPNR